ncbi:MAG: IS200/IS605 family element transposase accessory protein TnpB [Clostridia bacterium]|nr:IS200/IS605 family element transposase accessory protein TnpB [Clostridia bacterium]
MIRLLRAFKTEIKPTQEQALKIRQTIGICRFIYNFYLTENQKAYAHNQPFITANKFSLWLNNDFLPNNPTYNWIKDVSSKAVKESMRHGETAFKKFFKHQTGYPKLRKKNKDTRTKAYFPRNNKTDWTCERHRIKIPTLGWMRLKEKGYIPTSMEIRSGTISMRSNKYFVSVLIDVPGPEKYDLNPDGIGIDLGIKNFITCSNGMVFKNINYSRKVRKLEKQLRRAQHKLSRQYKNLKKGKATYRNIDKQKRRIRKLYYRLDCMRKDFLNKCVNMLVKTKPAFIAMEDLNVRGMLKNKHLSHAISQLNFTAFRTKLIDVCSKHGIPVKLINRWYPSSKTCHNCGYVKHDLRLSDRTYKCPVCGSVMDRDFQASLNIRDCQDFKYAC